MNLSLKCHDHVMAKTQSQWRLFVWRLHLVDLILLLKCHDCVNTNTTTLTRIGNTSTPGQEEACSTIVDFLGGTV